MEGIDNSKYVHVFLSQLDLLSYPMSKLAQTVSQDRAFCL